MKKTLITAILLLLALGAFVWWQREGDTPTQPLQTATTTVSTTTAMTPKEFFAQEPIIPEAKVSTEGWKTCRNEEYGYEFQFPPEWYVYSGSRNTYTRIPNPTISCEGARITLTTISPDDTLKCSTSRKCDTQSFSITFYNRELLGLKHKNATSVASFIEQNKQNKRLWLGVDAIWLKEQSVSGTQGQIWLLKDNDVYWITMTNIDDNLLETILSTFRFLDTASSTESGV